MPELTPLPIGRLVTRMFREREEVGAIFDLPESKFVLDPGGVDLSVAFHGRPAASPLGPAAGPHTQMAQNLVLSWLGGSRIFELKTVQILDELKIPRPCIDMRTVGFNAEWSQELKLHQSREEYVKGAMLVELLLASGAVDVPEAFRPLIWDLSVGYDLAGIRSEPVDHFIREMMDASDEVERLRRELPTSLGELRELDFATRLADSVTLSTFHGCPPHEIEGIIRHLMEAHGLHCTVKFNPTLLGPETLRGLLHEELGYHHLRVPDSAFEEDTRWDQAEEMVGRLRNRAAELGVGFGVKLSNTLIVENATGFLPPSEKVVYLSGAPLHVLAMHLVRRVRRTFGGELPISFAAGIDQGNVADAVALGLVPITVCSDLLQPGGYGRLASYARSIRRRMGKVQAASVDELVLGAYGRAGAALDAALPDLDSELRSRVLEEPSIGAQVLEPGGWARWLASARVENAEAYVAGLSDESRYRAERQAQGPKKIGRHLVLFDCLTCDKCIPVCPNDAIFRLHAPEESLRVERVVRRDGGWQWEETGVSSLSERHQIAIFGDFCNECGNCDVFCPEDGGPYAEKPLFFGSLAAWESADRDGFFVERGLTGDVVHGRVEGGRLRLEVEKGRARFVTAEADLQWDLADPAASVSGTGGSEVDLSWWRILDFFRRAVLDGPPSHVRV